MFLKTFIINEDDPFSLTSSTDRVSLDRVSAVKKWYRRKIKNLGPAFHVSFMTIFEEGDFNEV